MEATVTKKTLPLIVYKPLMKIKTAMMIAMTMMISFNSPVLLLLLLTLLPLTTSTPNRTVMVSNHQCPCSASKQLPSTMPLLEPHSNNKKLLTFLHFATCFNTWDQPLKTLREKEEILTVVTTAATTNNASTKKERTLNSSSNQEI